MHRYFFIGIKWNILKGPIRKAGSNATGKTGQQVQPTYKEGPILQRPM